MIYDKTVSVIGENGIISKCLKSYEFRPQQIEMAKVVAKSLEDKQHLIVEAGTGVGKSFAYLVPLIFYTIENNKRAVVSTYTKTLQSQLCLKDLYFLKNNLGIDFSYTLCLGSENYICLRRLGSDYTDALFESKGQRAELKRITDWSCKTETGVKSNLGFMPKAEVWGSLCRDPDLCTGRICSYSKSCFYRKAKKRESESHILVVNHALFFTNIAADGKVLPDFEAVVFDEAQTLEDVTTSYLGVEVSNTGIKYLSDSIYNPKTQRGILAKLAHLSSTVAKEVQACILNLKKEHDKFYSEFIRVLGEEASTKRIRKKNIISNYLGSPLKLLADSLLQFIDYINSSEDEKLIKTYAKRCRNQAEAISFILNQEKDDYVYWGEIQKRKMINRFSLFASPVEIAKEMQIRLFDKVKPVILTSATLAAEGKFEFIKNRLGLKLCREKLLDSPFSYKDNVLLCMPKAIRNPVTDIEAYQKDVTNHIKHVINITRGRTFILFTSYRMINEVYDKLSGIYQDVTLLRQGDKPRYDLIEEFRANEHSVLLGTTTFWQGVDIPGRALECVIITKLPFAVPDDPITESRMELIRAKGGSPFLEYQVPQAVMLFKQGFGRLIRSKTDRGVVVVLDPRIKTKHYGKSFISALPDCKQSDNLSHMDHFLRMQVKIN